MRNVKSKPVNCLVWIVSLDKLTSEKIYCGPELQLQYLEMVFSLHKTENLDILTLNVYVHVCN